MCRHCRDLIQPAVCNDDRNSPRDELHYDDFYDVPQSRKMRREKTSDEAKKNPLIVGEYISCTFPCK